MKYPKNTSSKSLKQLTKERLAHPPVYRNIKRSNSKVVIHPRAPGCISVMPGDSLAPIKLSINNKPELFLWHTDSTSLHNEFLFSLQLLLDLDLNLTKFQLFDVAHKCALSIREQIQQYREVSGSVHSMQGQNGEHLVPLQFQGQGFQWDLSCEQNSPELFAKVLCQDMGLAISEYPNIAVKLRMALKSHKTRLANAFNETVANLPVVKSNSKPLSLDLLEIENSIQETLPSLIIRESKHK